MSIKYSPESVKKLEDIHAERMQARDLVLSFATWHFEDGQVMEVLYVRTPEGKLYEAGPHKRTAYFDTHERVWTKAEEIPADAEFIGAYHRPDSCA